MSRSSHQEELRRGPSLPRLRHFYRTAPLACPYVEGRVERKIITDIAAPNAAAFYDDLSRGGFRRSHHLAYRPACPACNACVPVRIGAWGFERTRSLRRLAQINRDIELQILPSRATAEQFRLFSRYQRSRHADSDMVSMGFADYRAMVEETPVDTRLFEFRHSSGNLVAVCLIDVLNDGFSAVYSFYDAAQPRRSLGSLVILSLIDEALRRQLPYVYLGYWIADSRKMAYKTRFRPLEHLGPEGWKEQHLLPGRETAEPVSPVCGTTLIDGA